MSDVNGKEFQIGVVSESLPTDTSHCYESILSLDPYKFSIGDTTTFGRYDRGGRVMEVKKPETIQFVGDHPAIDPLLIILLHIEIVRRGVDQT